MFEPSVLLSVAGGNMLSKPTCIINDVFSKLLQFRSLINIFSSYSVTVFVWLIFVWLVDKFWRCLLINLQC